jgi:hypothetical protein
MTQENQTYNNRAEQLSMAIDIAEKIINESLSIDEVTKKHFINFGQQMKEMALHPKPQFKNIASIKHLENDFLTYWNESSGEDVEMFWRLIAQHEIPFERKDLLKKVLLQKRIKNSIEYDHVIDGIVVDEQTGRISSDDAHKLNQYLSEFERRKNL